MKLLRAQLERDVRDLGPEDRVQLHVSNILPETFIPTNVFTGPWTARPDSYNIDTSNVLFILSGAFVGLDTVVKRRVAKGVRDQRYARVRLTAISSTLISLLVSPLLLRLRRKKRKAQDFYHSLLPTGDRRRTYLSWWSLRVRSPLQILPPFTWMPHRSRQIWVNSLSSHPIHSPHQRLVSSPNLSLGYLL